MVTGEMDEAITIPVNSLFTDRLGPCYLGIARIDEENYRVVHASPTITKNELLALAGMAINGVVSVHTRTEVSGVIDEIYEDGIFFNRRQLKQEFRNRQ